MQRSSSCDTCRLAGPGACEAMADVLSDIFDTIRLRGTLYFRTDYSPPWAVTVPAYASAARFHLVVQGRCHVALLNGQTVDLAAGDLILIPRGRAHVLADAAGRTPAPLEQIMERTGFTGRGAFVVGSGDPRASTQMVCGHLNFAHGADHPLLRALPDLVIMRPADRAQHPLLDEALRLVARRAFMDELGAAASIARLSEVFFIEAIRASIPHNVGLAGIMAAMSDPRIGRALDRIHTLPGASWTVETLASEAAMSRSRFAERFTELLGIAPMTYLSEWRLQKALARLSETDASVKEVAAEVGYQSTAAFTRAFAQRFGQPPSGFREH